MAASLTLQSQISRLTLISVIGPLITNIVNGEGGLMREHASCGKQTLFGKADLEIIRCAWVEISSLLCLLCNSGPRQTYS